MDPIGIRFDDGPRTRTTLPLCAAVGDADALAAIRPAFGDWGFLHLAAGCFRRDPDGLLVGHDAATAAIWFLPGDAAHTYPRDTRPLVALKRSMPTGAQFPNEYPFPAWPLRQTLDFDGPPPTWTEEPRVAFCGVAHRPDVRRLFINEFRGANGLSFSLVERSEFNNPDRRGFVGMLRAAQLGLCPPGIGRFSYRLYETLAAGRIPVVPPGTHTYAPADLVDRATILEVNTAAEVIEWWSGKTEAEVLAACRRNRAAWRDVCSPGGWLTVLAAIVRERQGTGAGSEGRT